MDQKQAKAYYGRAVQHVYNILLLLYLRQTEPERSNALVALQCFVITVSARKCGIMSRELTDWLIVVASIHKAITKVFEGADLE